ncbi:GNAT family N-acetyltransferase [Psychrobium sp. 1_MG-2023]|uniref:GNAT family N-acetyltransferase n=1 Tax=Psychrobium sp. 1_MG-2023 TaxID=3062624 RepID=UPI000C335D91|nr:GNAT family N-acetyltransferase [Psychrobium sp. 1_MG-2023]MDP2560680.1 GNAT family N-acetyltransferase [Psychrobium sp. 1_MG-2023]PKF56576.1 hypothetical protein CW748_08815 [Alteromonadales bacterium alter-6D02]
MDSDKSIEDSFQQSNTLVTSVIAPPLSFQLADDLSALSSSALELLEQHTASNIFLNKDWFTVLTEHALTADQQPYFACLNDENNHTIAILPLLSQPRMQYGLTLRTLTSLTNYYSPQYDLIYNHAQINHAAGLTAILGELKKLTSWDLIDISPLKPTQLEAFSQSAANINLFATPYWLTDNYYHPDLTTYSNYLTCRSSRVKNTLKRKTKKLTKSHQWQIDLYQSGEQLDEAIAQYHAVYNESWKKSEPFPEFINQLIYLASQQGWLRLGILSIEEKPVAAQLWLVANEHAYIYKLAYDEAYKAFSCGSILSTFLTEHVVEKDEVTTIDFLTGTDRYKADWMSHRQDLFGVQFGNSHTIKGLIINFANRLALLKREFMCQWSKRKKEA